MEEAAAVSLVEIPMFIQVRGGGVGSCRPSSWMLLYVLDPSPGLNTVLSLRIRTAIGQGLGKL